MAVVGVDFSWKFPDAPPCYCVAVRGEGVRCVLMTRKAKRIVKEYKVPKALATAALIYYTVLPLVRRGDVVLIDAEYDMEYLRKVRKYLEKVLSVSSVAVGHISDEAIERADKLSKVFRKRGYCDEKDPDILKFVRMIHPARGARFTP
ncbi:MAG: hypothetical protein RMJ15_00045 [Nitrososphaerota archaeon]|nr:hypothetical protein [Candidatus Bathyarchaeota archaeon]MDW8022126.1 hypothetical protein [Nitrososphaerota archaeon]